MELQLRPYNRSFRQQCIDCMRDTWNFNAYFPGITRENLVNEIFFDEAIAGATYSRVIIDAHERVAGYLFGTVNGAAPGWLSRMAQIVGVSARMILHLLGGHLGPRRRAWRTASRLMSVISTLESQRQESDGYVNLFFVSSSLRGQGWGKRLMDDFAQHCTANGCRRLYLWTDKGCNYGFYDRQGFSRIIQVSSPLLARFEDEPNGFAYVKSLA